MIDRLDIRPDDRVLLASIPDIGVVAALAHKLERGLIVGLAPPEELHAARKAASHLVNVIFQPGSAEEIPWQSVYFTKVIDLTCRWANPANAAREIGRVLAEDGVAYLKTGDSECFAGLGFLEHPPVGDILVFSVPARPEF